MTPSKSATPNVLAISTYELGQQPLVLARLASVMDRAGINYSLVDNSLQRRSFDRRDDFRLADGSLPTHIVISVPMHTATQLGRDIARQARRILAGSVHIVALGLYCDTADSTLDLFDNRLPSLDPLPLLELFGVRPADPTHQPGTYLPNRDSLPGISNYAYFLSRGEKKLVGYVESTTGCAHSCRHCPVPVVHKGRFKAEPVQSILTQIDRLYLEGARHITFGDPDFLNGPTHALRVVRGMHSEHPDLTFDATIKVEHILENPGIWNEMAGLGLKFVVSAFEHTSDLVLSKLDKGHTKNDILAALQLLGANGISVRPSLLPFTPWTTKESLLELIEFVFDNDLVESVDPVQLSIRLLIPLGSLLLEDPDLKAGPWDDGLLSFSWKHQDPSLDAIQSSFATIAEKSLAEQIPNDQAIGAMRETAYKALGIRAPALSYRPRAEAPPRLSESWFCCAEPTSLQKLQLGSPE